MTTIEKAIRVGAIIELKCVGLGETLFQGRARFIGRQPGVIEVQSIGYDLMISRLESEIERLTPKDVLDAGSKIGP